MTDSVGTLPLRGHTLLSGAGRTLDGTENAPLGKEQDFKDTVNAAYGVKRLRTNRIVSCKLVRNASAGALLPKTIVKYKSGSTTEVDGGCAVDHEEVAGVVDEMLPAAGVPRYDCFWIVTKGPSLVLTDLAAGALNVWSVGQKVTALTAATSGATTAGRARPFAVTTNVTNVMSIAFNRIGKALSAKTTANTNADLLIDVNIMT